MTLCLSSWGHGIAKLTAEQCLRASFIRLWPKSQSPWSMLNRTSFCNQHDSFRLYNSDYHNEISQRPVLSLSLRQAFYANYFTTGSQRDAKRYLRAKPETICTSYEYLYFSEYFNQHSEGLQIFLTLLLSNDTEKRHSTMFTAFLGQINIKKVLLNEKGRLKLLL